MRKKYIFIPLVIFIVTITGCSKEKVQVGRENPDVEIQKCIKLSEDKRFEEAVECLEIFRSRFPKTAYGIEADIAIADNYFRQGNYLLAADSYHNFLRVHPRHPKAAYAYYRLGLSYLEESPDAIDRDQQYLGEAIHYLRLAVTAFPDSPYHEAALEKLTEARSRVAQRNFYIGNFYYRTGEYKSAIPRFLTIINEYQDSGLVPETLYKLVVATGELKRVEQAKLFYSKLELEHKKSKWTDKAESKLSHYIEEYGDNKNIPQESLTEVTP